MPDPPSVFRANVKGACWLPDRCWEPGRGWLAHIGRAVRGELGPHGPHAGEAATVLDDTGREIEALLAEGVAPERGALLAPSLLFVYGTLMAGEGLHDHLREHLARQGLTVEARRASVAGRLFDLDAWPGLVPDPGSRERVTGELYPLDEGLLRTLDQVEDFFGYGQPGSSFRRLPIATVDARGAHALAWCYRVVDPAGAPLIPSGDWRRR